MSQSPRTLSTVLACTLGLGKTRGNCRVCIPQWSSGKSTGTFGLGRRTLPGLLMFRTFPSLSDVPVGGGGMIRATRAHVGGIAVRERIQSGKLDGLSLKWQIVLRHMNPVPDLPFRTRPDQIFTFAVGRTASRVQMAQSTPIVVTKAAQVGSRKLQQ